VEVDPARQVPTAPEQALGEDGLVTTCEEACDPIPASAPSWCRESCAVSCEEGKIELNPDLPCLTEAVRLVTCQAQEYYHQGCPYDDQLCFEAAVAYDNCLVALEQGGGGSGP
jgi:hypothetical protein